MPPLTVGRVIALLVLIAAFVLVLIGRLDLLIGFLIDGLALAMLVP